jgi:hypothetical protein
MLFGLEGVLAGQAMMGYGMGAGRAASSTAPAGGVKKSVGGIAGSLDKVVKTGHPASDSGSPASPRVIEPAQASAADPVPVDTPAPVTAAPAKIYEDPLGIRAGMANEELFRRFGPPTLEVTGASNGRLMTYSGKNGIVQLELRNAKVTLITTMTPHQAAVVLR